ncbi:MAG TPA: DUF3667 domain-containing protein [Nevskia sp.]|nr:DUF3667 domain-containing protein [Nevskia sp.]
MNCGAPLAGAYCSACGQETRIETPTVGEFVREFVQDQMALEGKLWRTLKLLVMKPGVLTLDYIAGRRQCYVRPLRLYLALSVLFFAVSGLFGHTAWMRTDPGEEDKPLFSTTPKATPQGAASKVAPPVAGSAAPPAAPKPVGPEVPALPTEDDLRDLTTNIPLLDARIHKYFKQTRGQAYAEISQAINNDAPLAMFFLLPLFAGLLQLAYLRHHLRYGVHLLFALHYHAFVFLDLLLQEIPWPSPLGAILNLAIPVYLVLALRRVYGGRWWLTGLGVGVLLLVYSIMIGVTMFAAAAVSILISS